MTANNVNKQAEIIRRLKSGEGANLSQNKLAELFGVARSTIQLAMKKLAEETAGEELPPDDFESEGTVVGVTDNGCMSVKPGTTLPVAVGDIWSWGPNQTTGLITMASMETGISYLLLASGSDNSDLDKILGSKADDSWTLGSGEDVVTCNVQAWKKRANKKHKGVSHIYIFCRQEAQDAGLVSDPQSSIDPEWFKKFGPNFLNVSSSEYVGSADRLVDDGVQSINDTSEIEVSGKEIKKASASLKDCPFRVSVSTRAITIVAEDASILTVTADEPSFDGATKAIEEGAWDKLKQICSGRSVKATEYQEILKRIGFELKGGYLVMSNGTGKVKLGGLESVMSRFEHLAEANDEDGINALGLFLDKLLDNPDPEIMNRIVDFMRFADVELDPSGDIITYKYVDASYLDSHSKKLDNSPGSSVYMKRVFVDANIDNECSSGLHVCSLSYVFKFWSSNKRLVRCRLNPRDIVAIPRDYKGAKIRCCRYTVIEDVTSKFLQRKLPVDFEGFFTPTKKKK